jgi:hypothetical protein
MSTRIHPSALNRLDPIAEAFVLRFEPTTFCQKFHRNAQRIRFGTIYFSDVHLRWIGLSIFLTIVRLFKSP